MWSLFYEKPAYKHVFLAYRIHVFWNHIQKERRLQRLTLFLLHCIVAKHSVWCCYMVNSNCLGDDECDECSFQKKYAGKEAWQTHYYNILCPYHNVSNWSYRLVWFLVDLVIVKSCFVRLLNHVLLRYSYLYY